MVARLTAALACALLSAPALAQDEVHALVHALVHVPVVEAPPEVALDILATGDFLEMGQVELLYRRLGDEGWRSLAFERREIGGWQARIPAREVLIPGIEYYIHSTDGAGGAEDARFASASSPQRITIAGPSSIALMERELARYDGQRSRARAGFSYVNYGDQGALPDNLWQVDADFTYRILGTLRSLRFGVSRMRATAIDPGETPTSEEAGYDHGFAELEVAFHDLVGAKGQIQLGANGQRFTSGGEGRVRLGLDPGTHVELFAGGAAGVGGYGGMGLFWDTVPYVPMNAGVVVSTFPNAEDQSVQLFYELSVPLGQFVDIQGRGTYQARTALYGGIGGGLGFSWSF